MSLRLLLVLTVFCVGAFAQGQKEGAGNPDRTPPSKRADPAEEGSEDGRAGDVKGQAEESWENLTPEERLERGLRRGASSYCRFVASVRPSRLMPGQTGTMFVTAVLVGSAVLQAPAPLQITSPATQGMVTLGAPNYHPAKPGTLAAGYLGRPVYDNTAILEIPITVAADAQLGKKQTVHVDFKFDLYDGTSAQVVGRFIDRASADVEVGATSDPSVAASRPTSDAGADASSNGASRGPAAVVELRPTGPEAMGGQAVTPMPTVPDAPSPAVTDAEASLPTGAPSGGLSPLLIGGGVLALAIVALLFLRR